MAAISRRKTYPPLQWSTVQVLAVQLISPRPLCNRPQARMLQPPVRAIQTRSAPTLGNRAVSPLVTVRDRP